MHKEDWIRKGLIYLFPTFLFMIGCVIHYQRGYYYVDLHSTHAKGADDAYISYRYGWNLAQHGTLSWNESAYRRTEGFTNPLWVFMSALWALLGRKELVYPLMVITSVGLCSGFLLIMIKTITQVNHSSKIATLGLIFMALTPTLWVHATSGLESAVFGFGLATLAYLVLFKYRETKPPWYLFLLVVTLAWLRSDAFMYLGIILIGATIAESKSWKMLIFATILSVLLLLIWRQLTFGEWLPNTAIAKVNFAFQDRFQFGSQNLLAIFASSSLLILLLLGLAGLGLNTKRVLFGGAFILVAWMGYFVYIGGDIYLERHLVGLFILAAAFSAPLWIESSQIARIILVGVVFAGIALSYQRDGGRFNYLKVKMNDPMIMLGQEMAKDRPSYGVVITSAGGKIPFFAGGDFIDLLGLNDPYLATLQRERFIPGHSAGNDLASLELAREHPAQIYSIFTFLDKSIISGPEDIRLWVNNRNPQVSVQLGATQEQWEYVLRQDDFYFWSIISHAFIVNYHNQ